MFNLKSANNSTSDVGTFYVDSCNIGKMFYGYSETTGKYTDGYTTYDNFDDCVKTVYQYGKLYDFHKEASCQNYEGNTLSTIGSVAGKSVKINDVAKSNEFNWSDLSTDD